MRSQDWNLFSRIGLILGIIFLLGGVLAYEYLGWYFPYQNLAVNLWISGIVLFVIGYFFSIRAREEMKFEKDRAFTSEVRYCSTCGQKMSENTKYCSNCGKETITP